MGRIDNTKLFYISGGLIIGLFLLLAATVSSKTSSFLTSENGEQLQVVKTASGKFVVNGAAPTSTWKKIGASETASAQYKQNQHDSGYTPKSAFANNYVRAQDVNYPLIASAKFIKKKDKLKSKKKKDAAKLSKKSSKPRYDEHGNLIGLSESAETYATITTASTSQPANTAKKNKEQEEEDLNTVEFWIDPIFNQQDPNAVNKLIDAYQTRKVSSTVFNELVSQMTEDERAAIREMSLDAMSASPSTNSFTHLSWMKHNDTEPTLRTEAGRQVASYINANRLNYVIGALKTSDNATVTVEALRTLTASTKKYGGGDLAEQGEDPTPTPKTSTNLNTLEPRYSHALEVIEENNYSSSSNAAVKTEATKTVAAINKFMTI